MRCHVALCAATLLCAACGTEPTPAPGVLSGTWRLANDDSSFRAVFALKDTALGAGSIKDTVTRWMTIYNGDTVAIDAFGVGKGTFYAKGDQGSATCVAMRLHSWSKQFLDRESTESANRFRLQCSARVALGHYDFDTNQKLDIPPSVQMTGVEQMYIAAQGWPAPFGGFIARVVRDPE